MPATAEHYIGAYRNLLRFVEAALADSPAEPERKKLVAWQNRLGCRLEFWNLQLRRIRQDHGHAVES